MFYLRSTAALSLFALAAIGGCSNANQADLGRVAGTVLIDGQPAPAGLRLTFDPTESGVRRSTAVTDDAGRYEAVYSISQNGVRLGDCVVKLTLPDTAPPVRGKNQGLPYPDKYYDEIRQVTIAAGSNDIDLEISSHGN